MAACAHARKSWSNGEFVCSSCGLGDKTGARKPTPAERLERAERELASWSPALIDAHADSYGEAVELVQSLRLGA